MTNNQFTDWLDLAVELAQDAGKLVCQMRAKNVAIKSKGFRDVVTEADIAAQKLIAERVMARFPDHGFLAEEEDSELPENGPVRWCIDPIDGTYSYSRNMPTFCVSIGVMVNDGMNDIPMVGVIYAPMLDELYTAIRGQGAWLNGQPIQVSGVDDLNDAAIGIDWGRTRADRGPLLRLVERHGHDVRTIRAFGSAALALAWVAAGRFDFYMNQSLKAWDVAAAMVLMEEAGGVMTATNGEPLVLTEAANCIASNQHLSGALSLR